MNPMGNGTPGTNQNNTSWNGNVYAAQNGNINISNTAPSKGGMRMDTKVFLVTLLVDVVFFFYGMLAYTGTNNGGDTWRAGIFITLFLVTAGMIGRWVRRRM